VRIPTEVLAEVIDLYAFDWPSWDAFYDIWSLTHRDSATSPAQFWYDPVIGNLVQKRRALLHRWVQLNPSDYCSLLDELTKIYYPFLRDLFESDDSDSEDDDDADVQPPAGNSDDGC